MELYTDIEKRTKKEKNLEEWEEPLRKIEFLKPENELIIEKINQRAWEKAEIFKKMNSFMQGLSDREMRQEFISLRIENQLKYDQIERLEKHISELEGQIEEICEGRVSNKNNIMKIMQLTKEAKDFAIREAEYQARIRELEGKLKHQNDVNDVAPPVFRLFPEDAKAKIAEYEEKLNKMNLKNWDLEVQEKDLRRKLEEAESAKAREDTDYLLIGPTNVAASVNKEDIQDAIRQLSLIILSKDNINMSDETKRLIKEVFPQEIAQNISQYENRIRELEEQNQRLLRDLNSESAKKMLYLRTIMELAENQLELILIFENTKAHLPLDLQTFREKMFNQKERIETIYQESVQLLNETEDTSLRSGRESLLASSEKYTLRKSDALPSNPPLFGYNPVEKSDTEAKVESPEVEQLKEEILELKRSIEHLQNENINLTLAVTQHKQREEILERAISELKYKNESILRSRRPGASRDTSPYARMSRSNNQSLNSSFSQIADRHNLITETLSQKMAGNIDYLMLLHAQALALEERMLSQKLEKNGGLQAESVTSDSDLLKPVEFSKSNSDLEKESTSYNQ